MKVAGEGFRLDSKNKNEMTITSNQRLVWGDEWGSKHFFDGINSLKHSLRQGYLSSGNEVIKEWIHITKKFNSDLDLYEIEVESDDSVGKKVYWQEVKDKGVSLTIKCLYFESGHTSCN